MNDKPQTLSYQVANKTLYAQHVIWYDEPCPLVPSSFLGNIDYTLGTCFELPDPNTIKENPISLMNLDDDSTVSVLWMKGLIRIIKNSVALINRKNK